jgi:subtilisin family serine protease
VCAGLLLVAAAATAEPLRALEGAVARGVLDADVLDTLRAQGEARILAVFEPQADSPASARPDAARASLAGLSGFRPGRRFESVPVLHGHLDAAALAALVADPHVVRVSLDARVEAQLLQTLPLVGLDLMRAGGFTGSGATVAVIDTGVDLDHPDLIGSVIDEYCYCDDGFPGPAGCCPPNNKDEQGGPGAGQDDQAHGTRVASILTSAGVHAPLGGAPDVSIIAVKVLDSNGSGYVSDLISGMNWVWMNHPGIEALNFSLGFGLYVGDCDMADANTMAMAMAIANARATGTLVIAGAGNSGSGNGMIAPACVADAISVGAVYDDDVGIQAILGCTDPTTEADQVTCWSNSGPNTDVFAPGARIVVSQLDGTTTVGSGTSFATPVVSACAALLAHEYPSASVADLETALETSSVTVEDTTNGLEFPRLDCVEAFHALPEPGALPGLVAGGWLLAALVRRRAGPS